MGFKTLDSYIARYSCCVNNSVLVLGGGQQIYKKTTDWTFVLGGKPANRECGVCYCS